MCVNVAVNGPWINNQGQRLAGTGIFVSRAKNCLANHDDPLELRMCRLHFERRHNGSWGEIPRSFSVAVAHGDVYYGEDKDVLAYRRAIMADTPIGRGYWKSQKAERFHFPPYPLQSRQRQMVADCQLAIKACTKGRWAFVLARPEPEQGQRVQPGEAINMGAWSRDSYGCHLSYAIPVGGPVEIEGGGDLWHSDYGSLGVKIPWGTRWALWVRCSDTGAHSGFTVFALDWSEYRCEVAWHPVLASLFPAPHILPPHVAQVGATLGATLRDALDLAATIAAR